MPLGGLMPCSVVRSLTAAMQYRVRDYRVQANARAVDPIYQQLPMPMQPLELWMRLPYPVPQLLLALQPHRAPLTPPQQAPPQPQTRSCPPLLPPREALTQSQALPTRSSVTNRPYSVPHQQQATRVQAPPPERSTAPPQCRSWIPQRQRLRQATGPMPGPLTGVGAAKGPPVPRRSPEPAARG